MYSSSTCSIAGSIESTYRTEYMVSEPNFVLSLRLGLSYHWWACQHALQEGNSQSWWFGEGKSFSLAGTGVGNCSVVITSLQDLHIRARDTISNLIMQTWHMFSGNIHTNWATQKCKHLKRCITTGSLLVSAFITCTTAMLLLIINTFLKFHW